MFNITLIERRATDVINGFNSPKGINASDTLKVLLELKRVTEANRRLENALLEARLLQDNLTRELQSIKDNESFKYKGPDINIPPPFDFTDLFRHKNY